MTQPQVAEKVGITPGTYQKYEYGTAFPSPEKIDELAKVFGVEISELYIDHTPKQVQASNEGRSSRLLKIQDELKDLSDDQLGAVEFTIKGLKSIKAAQKKGIG